MFNPPNNSANITNPNINATQNTAARTNSGGSMSQNILHPQYMNVEESEFFRSSPSLGDICASEKGSTGHNDTDFLRPAEIFINSSDIELEKEPENDSPLQGNIKEYLNFKKQKHQLADIVNHAAALVEELNMDSFTDNLKKLGEKTESRDFKIQIVGTFKNGKSTFINSFLGEAVLPAYALPCTAVINEVKYGEKKRAVLHFKNPIPSTLPKELSEEAVKHMKKYNMENIPPMEIPYDDIEKFVVIPMGKDPKEMLLESPYEKVELFWPMKLLESGIEIIDSPGLNEHATRTKVTMDYISKADAVILVLNATALCSMEEMTFIESNLQAQGFSDLFFIVNRFDMIPEKEQERIMKFAKKKLGSLTNFGEDGIFFTSAKNALDAKKESDIEKLKESGMVDFEQKLSEFLTQNRGSSKLYLTSQKLKKLLIEEVIKKIIPRRKAMLETSLDDLKEKYQNIAPKFELLETKKELLIRKIFYSIDQHKVDFKEATQKNVENIVAAVPVWVNDFVPFTRLGMLPNNAKIRQVLDEISIYLAQRVENHNRKWHEKVLFPVIKEKRDCTFPSVEKEIRIIAEEVSGAVSSIPGAAEHCDIQSKEIFSTSHPIDYDDFQIPKNISARVSGESLLVMFSFINSWAFSGLLTAKHFNYSQDPNSGVIKKIKETVINEVTKNFSNTKYEFSDSVAENISMYYKSIVEKMLEPVNYEIAEMRNQMVSAISDIETGEESVKEKKSALDETEVKIKSLCIALENFAKSVKAPISRKKP